MAYALREDVDRDRGNTFLHELHFVLRAGALSSLDFIGDRTSASARLYGRDGPRSFYFVEFDAETSANRKDFENQHSVRSKRAARTYPSSSFMMLSDLLLLARKLNLGEQKLL